MHYNDIISWNSVFCSDSIITRKRERCFFWGNNEKTQYKSLENKNERQNLTLP